MRRKEDQIPSTVADLEIDGGTYTGGIKDGLPHDWGTKSWPNGDYSSGEYRNGKLNGYGKIRMTTPEGVGTVEGQFRDDALEGEGTVVRPNGTVHSGFFTAGQLNGAGTLTQADGTRYVGQFKNGRFDGEGLLTNIENGFEYVGEFQNHLFHGHGRLQLEEYFLYEGEFQNGLKHGRGVQTLKKDGEEMLLGGNWEEGECKAGAARWADDAVIGKFEEGNFVSDHSALIRPVSMLLKLHPWFVGLAWLSVACVWIPVLLGIELPGQGLFWVGVIPGALSGALCWIVAKLELRRADRLFREFGQQSALAEKSFFERLIRAIAKPATWPSILAWGMVAVAGIDWIGDPRGFNWFNPSFFFLPLVLWVLVSLFSDGSERRRALKQAA